MNRSLSVCFAQNQSKRSGKSTLRIAASLFLVNWCHIPKDIAPSLRMLLLGCCLLISSVKTGEFSRVGNDLYFWSGSEDFRVYGWKIPATDTLQKTSDSLLHEESAVGKSFLNLVTLLRQSVPARVWRLLESVAADNETGLSSQRSALSFIHFRRSLDRSSQHHQLCCRSSSFAIDVCCWYVPQLFSTRNLILNRSSKGDYCPSSLSFWRYG